MARAVGVERNAAAASSARKSGAGWKKHQGPAGTGVLTTGNPTPELLYLHAAETRMLDRRQQRVDRPIVCLDRTDDLAMRLPWPPPQVAVVGTGRC
jgi:hypothetical protein